MSDTSEQFRNLERRIDALSDTVDRQAAQGRRATFVNWILVSFVLGLVVVVLIVLLDLQGALR